LTIMALLVPEGMAYAQLAGMPPQAAFYAAPIGLLLYAIFGTSRQLVVAVSSAVAVMSASIVGGLVVTGSAEFIAMTAALAILAGIVAVLAGFLRLGRIAQFFSESVLTGFMSGLALVIMIKQVPKLFGLEPVEGNFWQRVIKLIDELPETDLITLAVGLSALVLMIFLERRFKRIPAALIVLIYGIAVVSIFNLAAQGVEIIGEIPSGLAPPRLPDIGLEELALLIPGALAITLVMFSEAVGPDRSFASKHHYAINENQELIGIGAANIGAGLFQGFPIGASMSKSAASDSAGGRTQVAGIVAAVATALVALFLTPLLFNLPEAALAAIVIVAVSGMLKLGQFRHLYRLRKGDFWLAVITFLCVLSFEEALVGLLIGVLLSLFALVWRTSSAKLSVLGRIPGTVAYRSTAYHPQAIQDPGLLIIRPDEEVFFANAATIRKGIRRRIAASETPIRTTILDLEMTNELDVPGTEMLAELHDEHEAVDIQFKLVGIHAPVMEMLDASGLSERIGAENIYPTILEAVLAYASEHLSEISADDLETFIDRIDALAEFFTFASEHVSEEHQAKLEAAINRLEGARGRLESGQ
ncbi:MAG: SulP family inorganic anion transporter, partial [Anaerolineales bacterium]|nr:SulP family inorganic anion transporter [Anaerolineales bacterium]